MDDDVATITDFNGSHVQAATMVVGRQRRSASGVSGGT